MSRGPALLPPRPLVQAALAFAAAGVGYGVDVGLGAGLLLVLALLWPPAVAWRPVRVAAVLRVYVPFACGWLLFVAVYLRSMHALGMPVAPQPGLLELAQHGLALPRVGIVLATIVVVAPLVEEVLFRGYLFTALASVLGRWSAHLATALVFGLVHGAGYALPIAVLSLLFGWLRERHQALLPAVLAHAVHNGITVALTIAWPSHLDLLYPR